jgi:hypothetical protein
VIWLGCTVAWLILGGAVHLRTDSLSGSLTDEVYALWGPPGRQAPPLGTYQKLEKTEEKVVEQTSAGSVTRTVVHETKVFVMQVTGRTDWTRANRERRARQAELAT